MDRTFISGLVSIPRMSAILSLRWRRLSVSIELFGGDGLDHTINRTRRVADLSPKKYKTSLS
jgi:hypothetical protein